MGYYNLLPSVIVDLRSVTIYNIWPEICYHILLLVVTKPEICYIWPESCYHLFSLVMAKHDNFPELQVLLPLLVTESGGNYQNTTFKKQRQGGLRKKKNDLGLNFFSHF